MELSSGQEDELRLVLAAHPIGISTDALYNKCSAGLFADRMVMAKCIHAAKQQGWMHTKNGLHFLVTTAKDYNPLTTVSLKEVQAFEQPKIEAPSAEVHATVNTSITQPEPVEAVRATRLPFGDLHRSKSMGAVALALFKWRAEPALV